MDCRSGRKPPFGLGSPELGGEFGKNNPDLPCRLIAASPHLAIELVERALLGTVEHTGFGLGDQFPASDAMRPAQAVAYERIQLPEPLPPREGVRPIRGRRMAAARVVYG